MINGAVDVGDLVGKIRLIRGKIEEIEKRQVEELKELKEFEGELLGKIMRFLQDTGQQNAKTPNGTAYLAHKESFKVEDQAEFRHHVIGTEAWELIEWRANRTGVRAFEEKHKELPPGMTKSVLLECRVLAPEKPRIKKPNQVEITQEQAGPTGFE